MYQGVALAISSGQLKFSDAADRSRSAFAPTVVTPMAASRKQQDQEILLTTQVMQHKKGATLSYS